MTLGCRPGHIQSTSCLGFDNIGVSSRVDLETLIRKVIFKTARLLDQTQTLFSIHNSQKKAGNNGRYGYNRIRFAIRNTRIR